MHRIAKLTPLVATLLIIAPPADAWFSDGHDKVAQAAVSVLPEEVPAFFRLGARTVGHLAVDADAMKLHELPQLRAAESPEHYLDIELLGGRSLPEDRYRYLQLLEKIEVEPDKAGTLPYALIEGVQRLTLAFAEHRRRPNDPAIQAKTLVYAGLVAHYAGDLVQPLHTTVHHNGRAKPPKYESPRTGIHFQVDDLFSLIDDPAAVAAGVEPKAWDNPWLAILGAFAASHELVDRVYAMEPQLPKEDDDEAPAPAAVVAFAHDRFRTTTDFLSSLFLTAWKDSADIELPEWLVATREGG